MRTQRNSDAHAVIVGLLLTAAIMLVCAAFWFFVEQVNDLLQTPGEWVGRSLHPAEDASGWEIFTNMLVALVGMGIILVANLLVLPGAIVGAWALIALVVLCLITAGYLCFRVRQRG